MDSSFPLSLSLLFESGFVVASALFAVVQALFARFRRSPALTGFVVLLVLGVIGFSAPSAEAKWGFFEKLPAAPTIGSSEAWREQPLNTETLLEETFPSALWWQSFNDANLNAVVETALQANHTLAQAESRLKQANALVAVAKSAQLPQVDLAPSYSNQRFSKVQFPFSGGGAGGFGNTGIAGKWIDFFNFPLQARYELDLWGKHADKTKASREQAKLSEWDYHNLRLQVAGETTAAYLRLLLADDVLARQERISALLQQEVERSKRLQRGGLQAAGDVALREQAQAIAAAQIGPYKEAVALSLNQLAVLMGKTPAEVAKLPRASLKDWEAVSDASLPVGLPSDLILHRPDIQASETDVRRVFYDVRSARKAFLPTIQFTTNVGFFSATDYRDFFAKDALGGLISVAANQPVFRGGALKAGLKLAEQEAERVSHAYQDKVLVAFSEVENSLASFKGHREQAQALTAQVEAKGKELLTLQQKAKVGLIASGDLYPNEAEWLVFQQAQASARVAGLLDRVSLMKALGGGY